MCVPYALMVLVRAIQFADFLKPISCQFLMQWAILALNLVVKRLMNETNEGDRSRFHPHIVMISDSFGGKACFDNFQKIVYPIMYQHIMTESKLFHFSKL